MRVMVQFIKHALFVLGLSAAVAGAVEMRRWTGAAHFANPLHDWSREDGVLIAEPLSFGSRVFNDIPDHEWARLFKSSAVIGDKGSFSTSFRIQRIAGSGGDAGIWIGLKSETPSPRNVWIHPPKELFFVGINGEGNLVAGEQTSDTALDLLKPVQIQIDGTVGQDEVSVEARPANGKAVRLKVMRPSGSLSGAVSLVARGKGTRWNFGEWTLEGDAVTDQPEHAVGPIIWTQYTLQDSGRLKLQAQMVPLETTDPQTAELQFLKNGKWNTVAEAKLDALSATFLFRVEKAEAVPYRVVYRIRGTEHFWNGSIRPNPKDNNKFKVALFTGDHGEIFPQDTMVGNVTIQNPDLLFFAGDQIYEIMDNISPIRRPLEGARLSYLSKWFQFGLTWRSVLKDRPSVIIPDDHDVFVGNVWGDNGLGYIMNPRWVNMVQRTQCGSLPDPVDPAPVKRGIGVYFTALDYAGMSFAIIEDRKFKSQPLIFTGAKDEVASGNGEKGTKVAVELFKQDPRKIDLPEANLLGERQLRFLTHWTARTEELPVRWFLSQTIFAKATTHAGAGLKRFTFDLDTNGWPQSKRDKALRTLGRDTIMLHGDLHLGILVRLGIDEFDDGPLAFMVTVSCVGFPRAWWPDHDRAEGGKINGPYTGRYFDDLGNRLTVHGVTNPERVNGAAAWGRTPPARPDFDKLGGVFNGQHIKGSGHGIVVVDKKNKTEQFNAYRLDMDAANPNPTDQFAGFPITLPLADK